MYPSEAGDTDSVFSSLNERPVGSLALSIMNQCRVPDAMPEGRTTLQVTLDGRLRLRGYVLAFIQSVLWRRREPNDYLQLLTKIRSSIWNEHKNGDSVEVAFSEPVLISYARSTQKVGCRWFCQLNVYGGSGWWLRWVRKSLSLL